jgi:uncharacterized protein YlxW (UPF0749 family)
VPAQPSLHVTGLPVSFGVLMLSIGVTWFVSLTLSGVLYRAAAARGEELQRETEQRMDREVAQLRAAVISLQTQLDLRAQDLTEHAREIERLSSALENVRGPRGSDARSARMRRERH